MHIRQAAGGLERRHVAFQERLLRLAGIDPVAGLPRARQAVGEHVAPGRLAGQAHGYVTEVDLGLGARVLGLRHEPPPAPRPRPAPPAPPPPPPPPRLRPTPIP